MKIPQGRNLFLAASMLGIGVLLCGFGAGDPAAHPAAPFLYVSAPEYAPLAALKGEERFPKGGQIMLFESAAKKPAQLVPGFFAAVDPEISFDAKSMLFAGKKSANDAWQIYEMNLASREVRAVLPVAEDEKPADLIRPLYLPYNRLVFARRTARGFELEAAQLDGKNIIPLTFIPGSALPVDVLVDGRILFESNYPLGTNGPAELYLVYSDGSGVESDRCDHPGKRGEKDAEPDASSPAGRWGGHELADGDVLFTHGESLARFSSPYATEKPVAAPKLAYSSGPVEMRGHEWLASAKAVGSRHDALYLLHGATARMLLADAENDLVEPVPVEPREVPHMHPSGLHTGWQYGNFLALDVRETRDAPLSGAAVKVRMEALDANGKTVDLGTAPVESDGSFFVQTSGNIPVRFILEDKDGRTLRAQRGWTWIAKGEQRICVGCHTGPERASENKVPAVLLRTTTPADLNLKVEPAQNSNSPGEK